MDEQGTLSTQQQSFWARNRLAIVIGGAFALLVVAGAVVYALWLSEKNSPQAALVDLASAAVSGDATTVAESIDTTAVVDSAIDDVFSEARARRALIGHYLATHPDATEESIKAKARELLDEELREHVESGTLPKRIPLDNDTIKELAAKAFARGAVRSTRIEGNTAHVLVVTPYKGKTLKVWVLMKRENGKWKVVGVENLSEVLKQAGY